MGNCCRPSNEVKEPEDKTIYDFCNIHLYNILNEVHNITKDPMIMNQIVKIQSVFKGCLSRNNSAIKATRSKSKSNQKSLRFAPNPTTKIVY